MYKLGRAAQSSKEGLHHAARSIRLSGPQKCRGRDLAALFESPEAVHRPGLLSVVVLCITALTRKDSSGKEVTTQGFLSNGFWVFYNLSSQLQKISDAPH